MIESYFATIPSAHRALILAGGITLFWLIETGIPLLNFKGTKLQHAKLNLFLTFTTIAINFPFAVLLVAASDWTAEAHFGILHWFALPSWAFLIVGLLLMDLVGAYLVHLIEHKIKVLWKFHMVHHADTQVDTTTANRHHPGESVIRAVFAILAILVCGAPMWIVFLYQSLSVVLSQFNHANIRLPLWLDNALSYVIISPNMHKVHHHFERPQTDSNYGNIFAFWDRLFRTYDATPIEQIKYGLDVLENDKDQSFAYQLNLPFNQKIKTDE
jgi:sterol desaturase/sphingolipid hydroxylase (fatty acid hydroxylase superfamily)